MFETSCSNPRVKDEERVDEDKEERLDQKRCIEYAEEIMEDAKKEGWAFKTLKTGYVVLFN